MTGSVEWSQITFLIPVVGALVGVWYKLQSQISANKAQQATELAAYKLHVAETYTTKQGMAEQTAQILKAVDSVSSKLDRTNERIDGLLQPKPAPRSRSSS